MKVVFLCEVTSVIFVLSLVAIYVMLHSYRFPQMFIRDGSDNDLQHSRAVQQLFADTLEPFHGPIHVFSAVANLDLATKEYDSVFVNVWHGDLNTTFKCCFKYKRVGFHASLAILFHYMYSHAKVYKCVVPMGTEDLPYEVSLLPARQTRLCEDMDLYTTVVYPKLHTEELALCVKAAYGQLDPKELICWIEYHVFMGVDKIFFLVNNIDDMSMRVLDYYSSTGIIQMVNFTFPKHIKVKTKSNGNYQRVSTFDCQERMRGYSYAGLLDIDEYMIPKVHQNLKDLIKFYLQMYNNTAGITFRAEYFFKEWGKQKPEDMLDPMHYFSRTDPMLVRVKSIHIPERTKQMSVTLHDYRPTEGYRFVMVKSDMGNVHHYRDCPMDKRFGDCSTPNRYTDKQMLEFRNPIERKVWKTWKAIEAMNKNDLN